MRADLRSQGLLGALLLATAAPGCKPAAVGAPPPNVRPVVARDEAFGYPAEVHTAEAVYLGELVACDEGEVYLFLNSKEGQYVTVPWRSVKSLVVPRDRSSLVTGLSVWAAAGHLLTISHGLISVVTAPAWTALVTGSVVWGVSHTFDSGTCSDLKAYSRYPQGLPERMRSLFSPAPLVPPAPERPPGWPGPPEPPKPAGSAGTSAPASTSAPTSTSAPAADSVTPPGTPPP